MYFCLYRHNIYFDFFLRGTEDKGMGLGWVTHYCLLCVHLYFWVKLVRQCQWTPGVQDDSPTSRVVLGDKVRRQKFDSQCVAYWLRDFVFLIFKLSNNNSAHIKVRWSVNYWSYLPFRKHLWMPDPVLLHIKRSMSILLGTVFCFPEQFHQKKKLRRR